MCNTNFASVAQRCPKVQYPKESGYCAFAWDPADPTTGCSGTAKSVVVGRECFPKDYLGPPEFEHVQTEEEAFSTARDFLREIIRYAHSRKIQLWLNTGEMPFVPPNLIPPTSKRYRSFYCGTAIPHAEPAMLDIWEAFVASMIKTYPDADRYLVCTGSEIHLPADDPKTQAILSEYEHVRPLLADKDEADKAEADKDNDIADVWAADKLFRRIKARYPEAKLGVGLVFRGGQLRVLDAVLPKDISLINMVNWYGETAMQYFDGIEGRELFMINRITDDGCELNVQLNAMMYDHDKNIPDSIRYGLAGFIGQLNKCRGAEASAQYLIEGAWNPQINPQSFYERYLGRLYGPDALDTLLKAYLLLEENEKTLGWHGRRYLLSTFVHGNRMALELRKVDYKAEELKLDRTEVEKDIKTAEADAKFWDGRAAHCRQALELMRQARAKVLSGSTGWPRAVARPA